MSERRYKEHEIGFVLRSGGETVTLSDPFPVQTEQLQGWSTYVLDFTPFERMTLRQGDEVRLAVTDNRAGNRKRQFTGYLDEISAASEPWSLRVRAIGNLSKLVRTRQGGALDLSGMTDGQAVTQILQYCDVPVSQADIDDSGYVLGRQKPVKWLNHVSGLDMLQRLDEVFGAATVELGNGRVARIFYDLAPRAGAVRKVYRAGDNAEIYALSRNRGGVSRIQNAWNVYGVEFRKAGSKGCLYTPYARAGTNIRRFGPGRVGSQEFRSDIIQDAKLARHVARRLMRWYNREPDEIAIEALNDPAVTVGTVIAARDGTYGLSLGNTQRYTVIGITRNGVFMSLQCVGGEPGRVGDIDSGYEKVCNTAVSEDTEPIADPIEIPDIPAYTPSTEFDPIPASDFTAWPETTPVPAVESELPTAELTVALPEPCDPPCECAPSVPFSAGLQADATFGIRISGVFSLTSATPLEIGFTGADGEYKMVVDPGFVGYAAEIRGPGTDFATCGTAPIPLNTETPLYFCWDATTSSVVGAVGATAGALL